MQKGSDLRQPRYEKGFYLAYRETESYSENVDAENDATYKRIQQEMDESKTRLCFAVCLLQFLQGAFEPKSNTGDGSGNHGPRLDNQ